MGRGAEGHGDAAEDSAGEPWAIEWDEVARAELEAAVTTYELASVGLGERFLGIVSETIERIEMNPFLYQRVTAVHFRAVLRVFPFAIYYAVSKSRRKVLIQNIHHGHRHPKHWRRNRPKWRE